MAQHDERFRMEEAPALTKRERKQHARRRRGRTWAIVAVAVLVIGRYVARGLPDFLASAVFVGACVVAMVVYGLSLLPSALPQGTYHPCR